MPSTANLAKSDDGDSQQTESVGGRRHHEYWTRRVNITKNCASTVVPTNEPFVPPACLGTQLCTDQLGSGSQIKCFLIGVSEVTVVGRVNRINLPWCVVSTFMFLQSIPALQTTELGDRG